MLTDKKVFSLYRAGFALALCGAAPTAFAQTGVNSASAMWAVVGVLVVLLALQAWYWSRQRNKTVVRVIEQVEAILTRANRGAAPISAGDLSAPILQRLNGVLSRLANPSHQGADAKLDLLTENKLLAYKKNRLEAVLGAHPDAIVVLDSTGVATYANIKVSSQLGLEPQKIINHKLHEWCPTPEILALLNHYQENLAQVLRVEQRQFTPTHAPDRTVQMSAHPLFAGSESDKLIGTLVVFRDVTTEVLARRARSDFVAHVSHELKSPLNILAMYSESLMDENGVDESTRIEAVNVIHDEVERLSTLINNLLSITKIEMGSISLERTRVKLVEFLDDTFNAVSRAGHDSSLTLSLQLPKELSAVYIDKDLMRVAVSNLLTNAIKYNRPGGSVTLSAEETDDQFIVRVKDTGIGIAPNDLAKVFDKFYRADSDEVRERGGHGLGLALSKQIVDLHHGTLTATSILGQGTEFTLTLVKNATLMKQTVGK